jgi:aminoglycoside phosphotransferase
LVEVTRWLVFRRGQVLSMGVSAEKPVLMMAAVQGATAITAQAQG